MPQANLENLDNSRLLAQAVDFSPLFTYVIDHFDQEIDLSDLATTMNLSPWVLCRQFKRAFDLTPMRWLWRFRTILARDCIAVAKSWQLTDISVLCGFSSLAHFSRQYRQVFNQSPSQFRLELGQDGQDGRRNHCQLLFQDLATDRRDLLELAIKKSLQWPQNAG